MTARTTDRAAGFTLIELVITIAILAIALVAVAQSLMMSAQYGADSLWQTKTVELVQAYSDEILTKKYDQNTPAGGVPACNPDLAAIDGCSAGLGPDGGEQRSAGINDYNDVDDYDGLDDSPPLDSLGAVRTDYNGYRVQISVSYAGLELGLANDNNAKRIEIRVAPPGQPTVPFTVYRSNF